MLSLLSVLVLTTAVFAYIGRTSVPAQERVPVTTWNVKDLVDNSRRGLHLCSANTPLRRALDGLPQKKPTK
ncbi:hypothetical protein H4W26_000471 [Nesterenkonia halotolerans]|uniref:Secreted protein n=1 Tax=Nesterenkonia halotolerans TaxID=225325 RepID=A0ABR9J545_9MICC|nr:hypothetical protein [Nesterenkonia halotolerans]